MGASSRQKFEDMLSEFDPKVQALALEARALIHTVMPRVVEVVWERQRIAGYGTGPKKNTEHFCYIAPFNQHVNLGFNYGSELPDPEGLLEGSGKLFRHVRLTAAEDLERSGVRRLVEVASAHRVPPLPPE